MGLLDKLKGFDMLDMVPAGTIEDLVRAKAPDLITGLFSWARQRYNLAPGERMSFQLAEANLKGEEKVVLVPIVLDEQLRPVRKLPWLDVLAFVQAVPIAQYVREMKATAKVLKKLEPVMEKLNAALEAGDAVAAMKYQLKLQEMSADLPARMTAMLFGAQAEPAAPAQLPAAASGDNTDTDGEPAH